MTADIQKAEAKGTAQHQEFAQRDAQTDNFQIAVMDDGEEDLKGPKDGRVHMTDEQASRISPRIFGRLSCAESTGPPQDRSHDPTDSDMVSSQQYFSVHPITGSRVYFLQILDKSCIGYGATFGLREDAVSTSENPRCFANK